MNIGKPNRIKTKLNKGANCQTQNLYELYRRDWVKKPYQFALYATTKNGTGDKKSPTAKAWCFTLAVTRKLFLPVPIFKHTYVWMDSIQQSIKQY